MASPEQQASSPSATEIPWYDLLPDPQLPEDSMQQEDTIVQVMSMLKARYEDDATVLCVAVTDIIYDSNVRGSVVAPDGFIVFGVDARHIKRIRNSYRIEEWGQTPAFVLEVASESTASTGLAPKRELYARIGIREYWRLDRRATSTESMSWASNWSMASTTATRFAPTPMATSGPAASFWTWTSSTAHPMMAGASSFCEMPRQENG